MNQCYYKLNLPFNVQDINTDKLSELDYLDWTKHTSRVVKAEDWLSDRLLNFFIDRNMNDLTLLINYCPPNTKGYIHIDGDYTKARPCGINIPWGSNNSVMTWFKAHDNVIPKLTITANNKPHIDYDINNVEPIEHAEINSISLIRTNIPHQVYNIDPDNARWCMSIRVNSITSWISSVIRLNEYLIK